MTTVSEDVLELEVRIAARPSTVFSFLNSADGMAQWFGSSVEMDAKPGGTLRVDINGRDIAKGEIVEIVPGTIVKLRHSGLTAEQADSHKEGWDHFLPRLLEVAEGRDPGKDPWAE